MGRPRAPAQTELPPPRRRDPVDALYESGATLVESAAGVREAAHDPRAGHALPAVFGCMEVALRDLAAAAESLERTVDAAPAPSERACGPARRARARRGLATLRWALADAADAASATRSLVARALDRP
ncbi:MAG TPA: hypothetical protein VHB30_06555 [Solirubrobacteraceae bacterium]|nr:hypothetical protein [Solirubrobacteraceae bacterium]